MRATLSILCVGFMLAIQSLCHVMFSRAISASSSRGHECVLKIKIFRRYRFEFVLSDCRVNIVPSKWCMLCFAFGEIKPQNSTSQKVLVLFQVVNAVRSINKTRVELPGPTRDLGDISRTTSIGSDSE